uniref:dolichyl-phosphate-mannose--protein mannosyltransferase n=1 Tax=Heligmosomoides polygyrus TaxID=6339 RepID=A0A183GL72_HELPZ
LHGEWTLPYHVVNVTLHILSSILVFVLANTIRDNSPHASSSTPTFWDEATVAASVFAVHPIHVEAVANISGRSELLMSVLLLTALLLYHRCLQHGGFDMTKTAALSTLVALTVFSKEQGIAVLPLCLFLEASSANPRGRSSLRRSALVLLFGSALVLLRLHINGFSVPKFTELDNPAAFVRNPLLRLASYCNLWLINLRLLVLPYSLCFDYSMGCVPAVERFTDFRALALPLVALMVACGVYSIYRVPVRLFRFGVVLGVVSFLPASNLLVTVGFTIAERVLYLPSVGMCLIMAMLFGEAQRRFKNADRTLLAVLVIAFTMSYQRSEEWRTELDLYASGLRVCTQNAKVHYNLGKVLSRIGDVNGAEYNYWNAIRLNPNYEHAMNNLANILEAKGRSEEAELLLTKAIRSRPTFAVAWMNLGIALMSQEKHEDALKSFTQSLRLRPSSADCLFNLGNLYQRMGRLQDALDAWRNATALDPGHSRALTNLFVALDEQDECDAVVSISDGIPQTVVDQAAALSFQIGVCLGKVARFAEAERRLKTAVQLSPNNSMYHANLGVLYQRWARYELAESSYLRALLIDSETSSVRWNLQAVQEKLNRTRSSRRDRLPPHNRAN